VPLADVPSRVWGLYERPPLPAHRLHVHPTRRPEPRTVPTLTVGSWNVEWLDGRAGEGRMPRTERDYAELARVVASAGADVWTFQEVADEAAVRRLVPDDWTVHLESRWLSFEF